MMQDFPLTAEDDKQRSADESGREGPEKPAPGQNERKSGDGNGSRKSKLDQELDEELEETFPASDPPSLTREPH